MSEPGSVTARVPDELTFDESAGRFRLGTVDVRLSDGADNREILGTYVDLVGRRRGQRVASPVEVRDDDVDILAGLLDLDAVDIDALITEIFGTTTAQTTSLLDRLRARRRVLAFAAVAAGVVVAGGIALAAQHRTTADDRPVRPPAATSPTGTEVPGATAPESIPSSRPATTAVPPDQPVQTTPDGVGLVDPAQEDGQGVGLIPPVSVDNPDPGSSSTTGTAPGSATSGG